MRRFVILRLLYGEKGGRETSLLLLALNTAPGGLTRGQIQGFEIIYIHVVA